jgi:hypothetical protein
MSIVTIIVMLVLVGVGLYLVRLIPMDPTIQKIVTVLVILVVVIWLLEGLGMLGGSPFGRPLRF